MNRFPELPKLNLVRWREIKLRKGFRAVFLIFRRAILFMCARQPDFFKRGRGLSP